MFSFSPRAHLYLLFRSTASSSSPWTISLPSTESTLKYVPSSQCPFRPSSQVPCSAFVRELKLTLPTSPCLLALRSSQFFGETKPARSCVEVARLPKDVLVEVEVSRRRKRTTEEVEGGGREKGRKS